MEENKSKKSGGLPLVLVVLLVAGLVGCASYIIYNSEIVIAANKNNSDKIIEELRTEISNLKGTTSQKIDSVDIIEINAIKKKLDVIDGLVFSDVTKLSNDKIYSNVRFYLEKKAIIKSDETGENEIKKLAKEVFNIDYKGTFASIEFGEGDIIKDAAILKVEKQNKIYKVNYALINRIDADALDEVTTYYDAEVGINEDGDLYIKSNEINKNMTKNLD